MKRIPLTREKFAIVDDADFEWLNQWKWCAIKNRSANFTWYARRNGKYISKNPFKRERSIYMHRAIAARAGLPDVDHRDGDGLNNQRTNLRPCTESQNQHNRAKDIGGTSKFKGVYWNKYARKWGAQISSNYKKVWLGYFDSELKAAQAYVAAAARIHGEFSNRSSKQLASIREIDEAS